MVVDARERRAVAAAPALRSDAMVGAVMFHDCQEDDALFAALALGLAHAVATWLARHPGRQATPLQRIYTLEARAVVGVVLIGLMGAGKTAVGRRLAKRLALPFVDVDAEIEAS